MRSLRLVRFSALIAVVSVFASCVSSTYLDTTPQIYRANQILPDRAYFYGFFGDSPYSGGLHVIRFRETETREWISLPLDRFGDPILVEVPAGTYTNSFYIYTSDLFGWTRSASYPGPAVLLSAPFEVAVGSVYYVGNFSQEFAFEFEAARAAFVEQFGELPDIAFREAYAQ